MKSPSALIEWLGRTRSAGARRLIGDVISLYGAQSIYYLLPLITIPYLTRVLGPSSWGILAFAQTLSQYGALLMDYGFGLSATRSVSKAAGDSRQLAEIVEGVMGAKASLGLIVVAGLTLAWQYFPDRQYDRAIIPLCVFWALIQGFGLLWFFQGFRRLRTFTLIEVTAKGIAAVITIGFVRGPGDLALYFGIQGICSLVALLVEAAYMSRLVGLRLRIPRSALIIQALSEGKHLFLLKSSVSLYTVANSALLGFVGSTLDVGYYASAEKILRIGSMTMQPIYQVFFPHICVKISTLRVGTGSLVTRLLILNTSLATAFSLSMLPFGHQICVILFGQSYWEAGPVLIVLTWVLPLGTFSTVLGTLWLVPNGLDSVFSKATIYAGLINVIGCFWVGRRFHAIGVASSVVFAEGFVALWLLFALWRRGLLPWSSNGGSGGSVHEIQVSEPKQARTIAARQFVSDPSAASQFVSKIQFLLAGPLSKLLPLATVRRRLGRQLGGPCER